MNFHPQTKQSNDLRSTVFHTINLLSSIESDNTETDTMKNEPSQESEATQALEMSYAHSSPESLAKQSQEENLSEQFVSGIKDKLLDPSKIEKLEQGTGDALEQLRYDFSKKIDALQDYSNRQNSIIQSLQGELASIREQVGQLNRASLSQQSVQTHAQNIQPQQPNLEQDNVSGNQSESNPQQMQQPQGQSAQQALNQSSNQSVNQSPEQSPAKAEANPRVGNYNSNDVDLMKYFNFSKR